MTNQKNHSIYFLLALLIFLASCNEHEDALTLMEDFITDITPLETPSKYGGESNLFVSENGQVFLSWVEYVDDTTDVLLFSRLEDKSWTAPLEIARGGNWFVNWADFPSLIVEGENDQAMTAHWLQKSASGTFDYDVRIAQSEDGGRSWGKSFIPHTDGLAAEHGFVSMLPWKHDKAFAVWLDGRNTVGSDHNNDHNEHGHHGSMTLRSAFFDRAGNLEEESELDPRICDCCQTSAATNGEEILVAYRDRSEEEVRDISVVKWSEGQWSSPQNISKDQWKITGCPVNGPTLDVKDQNVVLAWYTMANDKAEVKVSFSEDMGTTFGQPQIVSEGVPLGRVDAVLIDNDTAVISWLEQVDNAAILKIKIVHQSGQQSSSHIVSRLTASRSSGFPRMVRSDDALLFSWTAGDQDSTKVSSAIIRFSM